MSYQVVVNNTLYGSIRFANIAEKLELTQYQRHLVRREIKAGNSVQVGDGPIISPVPGQVTLL